MAETKEKVTAPFVSATTDNEQSLSPNIETSIPEKAQKINDDFETAVEQVVNKQCSITVEIEEDDQGRERIRVKWINPLSNVKPIEDAHNFLRKLSARAKLVVPKAKEGKAPAPTRPSGRRRGPEAAATGPPAAARRTGRRRPASERPGRRSARPG